MWWSPAWGPRRGFMGFAQVERLEQRDFEPREQQGGAGLEAAGGGLVQDAQQHEGDQRDIDLEAHGILAAAEEAADFEVLLEPLEQQFDRPALLVEAGDLGGRAPEIVGQQMQRLGLVGAGHDDFAQPDIPQRVLRCPAARLAVADLEAAVEEDAVARGGALLDLAAAGVLLLAGNEEGAGRLDLGPPAVIGIALVEDVSGAGFQRHGAAGHHVIALGRADLEPHRPALPRVIKQISFKPRMRALASAQAKRASRSAIGVASSSRISAAPSRRSAPAATGSSAAAMSRNTAQGRARLASARVERQGARRLRW